MRCYCQNCDWKGTDEEVGEVHDLWGRVQPGEPLPIGQCPKCRALCQPEASELQGNARKMALAEEAFDILAELRRAILAPHKHKLTGVYTKVHAIMEKVEKP